MSSVTHDIYHLELSVGCDRCSRTIPSAWIRWLAQVHYRIHILETYISDCNGYIQY